MVIKAIQKILKKLSFYFYFMYSSGSAGSKKSCGMFTFLIKAVLKKSVFNLNLSGGLGWFGFL